MEATTSKEGGLNERGPKAIAHEMGLQVSHGVHSEVGGIQCGGIHQGEECNLDCPELSGTETPFDREEFLSARLFRFHGGDGQTIRAGIHLAAGAGGAAFGGAEHGVGASAAFRRLLTGPFEGLTEISPRPRWSLQNRPMVVTAKAANGDGPGQCCFTPLNRYRASPFWYASSGDRT